MKLQTFCFIHPIYIVISHSPVCLCVCVCVCVCVCNWKQAAGVSKANSVSAHIWLKTKLRIAMHRWIFFFLPPLLLCGLSFRKRAYASGCVQWLYEDHAEKKTRWCSASDLFCKARVQSFPALMRYLMYKCICWLDNSHNNIIMLLTNPRLTEVRYQSSMRKYWHNCLF